MVEAELALLEVEEERVRMHAPEPRQSRFRVAPEAFDAVDVVATLPSAAELVSAVIHPQVLLVSHVHQAVVALPSVGMNDAPNVHFAPNRGQKRGFRAVGNNLGVDLAVPLEDAEDRPRPGVHADRPASG